MHNSNQIKKMRLYSFVLLSIALLILTPACNRPGLTDGTDADADTVGTAVQETIVAQTVQAINAEQPTDQEAKEEISPSPPPSDTPDVSATASLTPEPSETPTPETAFVQVSVDTNCRLGPGKIYPREGALLTGEEAEIIARDPQSQYWYIRNPDKPSAFCWLWGYYATPEGPTDSLPVFTPPPTPTLTSTPTSTPTQDLTFDVVYTEMATCTGSKYRLYFKITNSGGFTLQSVVTTVTNNDDTETETYTSNEFEQLDSGCTVTVSQNDLTPGEVGYTTSAELSNDPNGKDIDATIKVCTEDDLGGDCVTKSLNLTP